MTFSDMTKIQKWQHFLRRKFQEVENSYYPTIDDLTQKLFDTDKSARRNPPDFDIRQFEFLKEWQNGDVSSKHVSLILNTMDLRKVADTQLTRRLKNYMKTRKDATIDDFVQPVINIVLISAVPLYVSYLNMLKGYFNKLAEEDSKQELVTWIEQKHGVEKEVIKRIDDLTLNQVLRQLDNQVMPFNTSKYVMGDNLICLDEELARGAFAFHWIFAPKSYIDKIKKEYKIEEYADLKSENTYIQKLIEGYLK